MWMVQKLAVVFCFSIISTSVFASNSEIFYENASGSPIFKFLQSAKTSINIEIYEMKDTLVQKAILNAMNRGVKVRVIQESESVGSHCPVFEKMDADDAPDCRAQKEFIQKIRSHGGNYIPYPYQQFCSDGQCRCLEHGKIILVDEAKALISTGNFNATNLCDPNGELNGELSTCNRDYTVVSTDSTVVATLLNIFNADFKGKAYDLPKILKSKSAQKVTVSPYSLAPIIQFIRSATQSILVENQYLKNADMNAALIAAAKKGVSVNIVVSSTCAFGKLDPAKDATAIDLWKNTFKTFDQAGIKSRAFTKKIQVNGYKGYQHAKAIVVDGNRAWVGSVNGSTQALTQNREYGIFFENTEQVSKLVKFIKSDFSDPNSESWQESLNCKKD